MNQEELSLAKTIELLLNFKHDTKVQKLKEFYSTKSFSEILKIERKEVSHSSFITWILDVKEQHNLGDFAIKRFLDILLKYGKDIDEKLYEILIIGNYTIDNFFIETEYHIKEVGFIDIFISMEINSIKDNETINKPINIIIENKVYSKENEGQTEKYYYHFENSKEETYKKDINIYIYLTPLSMIELNNLQEVQCECKKFIQINYQILSDNIFELIEQQNTSQRTKIIVQEYLKSLSKPIKDNNKTLKGKIMATTKQEQDLLKEFLNEHNELFLTAFKIRGEDPDLEPEERAENEKFIKNLESSFTRYNSLEEYIEEEKITSLSMDKLIELMKKLNEIFKDKITITYAPSNINIKIIKSNQNRKVFVYIKPQKQDIRLTFPAMHEAMHEKFPEGNNKGALQLSLNNDSRIEDYISIFQEAFNKLQD